MIARGRPGFNSPTESFERFLFGTVKAGETVLFSKWYMCARPNRSTFTWMVILTCVQYTELSNETSSTYDLNARKANQRKNRWPQPQKRGELKQRIEQLERERRDREYLGTPAEAGCRYLRTQKKSEKKKQKKMHPTKILLDFALSVELCPAKSATSCMSARNFVDLIVAARTRT
jgi:hypothetical protein